MQPDYIFETSWEVCNRVGGIYAVLSTRAASMQAEHPDKVFFFGPDFGDHSDIYFKEDKSLLKKWLSSFDFEQSGLSTISPLPSNSFSCLFGKADICRSAGQHR